jgi:hypothetical protein
LVVNISTRVVVRLDYQDLLNRRHEDYYEVVPIGGGYPLNSSEGRALFSKWQNEWQSELSSLRADELLARAVEKMGNRRAPSGD